MKKGKVAKRIIAGALSVVLAGSMFLGDTLVNVTDAYAKTAVFDGITQKYYNKDNTSGKVINVLEITPNATYYHMKLDGFRWNNGWWSNPMQNVPQKNAGAEMGYFMSASLNPAMGNAACTNENYLKDPEAISKGGRYHFDLKQFTDQSHSTNLFDIDNNKALLLSEYRLYGLVMPSGTDTGWTLGVGQYPMYGKNAVYATYAHSGASGVGGEWETLESNYEMGTYSYGEKDAEGNYIYKTHATDDNGVYLVDSDGKYVMKPDNYYKFVKDTYALDSKHRICDTQTFSKDAMTEAQLADWEIIKEEEIPDPNAPAVSDNSVSDNSLSGNDGPAPTPTITMVTVLVPLSIDSSIMALPRRTDTKEDVFIRMEDGDGDIRFDTTMTNNTYAKYYGLSSLTNLYYDKSNQARYKNSDWFIEYVLGDAKFYGEKQKNINYVSKAANEVSVKDINDADLIYISSTSQTSKEKEKNIAECIYVKGSMDISEAVMLALYNKEVNEHKAVMMDYLLYQKDVEKISDMTNVSKLAILLWQESQGALLNEDVIVEDGGNEKLVDNSIFEADAANKGSYIITEDSFANMTKERFDELRENMITDVTAGAGNGNFVTGNTYVYNHHRSDFNNPKSMVDAYDNFANGDFNTPYNDYIASNAFSKVQQYIKITNENKTGTKMATAVTPAVVIQYILVSDGADLTIMKTNLSVLEIQAAPAYLYNRGRGSEEYADLENASDTASQNVVKNRKAFVENYLSSYYKNRLRKITFTSMTVNEFNGRNEDLIENYDIIYIGDEIKKANGKSLFYTKEYDSYNWTETTDNNTFASSNGQYGQSGTKSNKVNVPSYYTSDMNGLIYYNIGDYYTINFNINWNQESVRDFSGFIKDEEILDGNGLGITVPNTTDFYDQRGNWRISGKKTVRLPARDITKDKLNKLKQYVQADGLVLVAEELFGTKNPGTSTNNSAGTLSPVINPTKTDLGKDGGRIDNSSNLYEFLNFGLGHVWDGASREYKTNNGESTSYPYYYDKNLVSTADVKRGLVKKESLNKYVVTKKLELAMTEAPVEYGYSTFTATNLTDVINPSTIAYMENKNEKGQPELQYKFQIRDTEMQNPDRKARYVVQLYIDMNNDGKYSKAHEDVADIKVVSSDGNEAARYNPDSTNKNNKEYMDHYVLMSGIDYTLTRPLTKEFAGIIKWKLNVVAIDNDIVHASQEGYTAVKNDKTKEIHILQIKRDGTDGLDLEYALWEERHNRKADSNTTTHNNWGKYLYDLPGMKVEIRTVTVSAFQDDFHNKYVAYNQNKAAADKLSVVDYAKTVYFKEYVLHTAGSKVTSTASGGNEMDYTGETTCTGVNMLVLGFGDDITKFSSSNIKGAEAVTAIQAFTAQGNPVLEAHDFLPMDATCTQTKMLRNIMGMDTYGVTQNIISGRDGDNNTVYSFQNRYIIDGTGNLVENSNGSDVLYNGTAKSASTDLNEVKMIEATGKEVAYKPNSNRGTVVAETQGMSSFLLAFSHPMRDFEGYPNQFWLKVDGDNAGAIGANPSNGTRNGFANNMENYHEIVKLNDGQITNFPYKIDDVIPVTKTHGQYFSLDLTSDADKDGEADVVVWYALGDSYTDSNYTTKITSQGNNPFSDEIGASIDPINGYYIYNVGNVTYTGAGHSDLADATENEIRLFINTLLASFETGNVAPEPGFYESTLANAKPVSNIALPYDANVTKDNPIDSSVLQNTDGTYKYQFVNPNLTAQNNDATKEIGTKAFFKVQDFNLVRGEKNIGIKYYLLRRDNALGDTIKLDDGVDRTVIGLETSEGNTINTVDITDYIRTYKATNNSGLETTEIERKGRDDNGNPMINNIESGIFYGMYLPMSLLNDDVSFTIYLEAQTVVQAQSTTGALDPKKTKKVYIPITVTKTDLLDLD